MFGSCGKTVSGSCRGNLPLKEQTLFLCRVLSLLFINPAIPSIPGCGFCSNLGSDGSKLACCFVVQISILNAAALQQSRLRSVYLLKKPAFQRSCLLGEPGTASVLWPPLNCSLSPEAKAVDHNFIQEQEYTVQHVISAHHLCLWPQLRLFTHLRRWAHHSAVSLSFWGEINKTGSW